MKKLLSVFLLSFVLILSACGSDDEKPVEKETKVEKEEKFERTIKLNDELKFEQYEIKMKQIKLYEKKGKTLADISFDWTNNVKGHDKTSFFIASLFDVKQGDEELEEINDAWNPENKLTSDAFFQNAFGGTTQVKLTYELADKETAIDLIITPTIDEDNPETIKVDIK